MSQQGSVELSGNKRVDIQTPGGLSNQNNLKVLANSESFWFYKFQQNVQIHIAQILIDLVP